MAAPILIIGFNRPDRLARLINSLRPYTPETIRISLDGPRPHKPHDAQLVESSASTIELIDWTADVTLRREPTNVGLARAIPAAVNWVLSDHESVIVIEDDVIVGPHFVEFMLTALEEHATDDAIMHVSGYNVVPDAFLSHRHAGTRLSRIPESLAWGTWRHAWSTYDPSMAWASTTGLRDLATVTGSRIAALRWHQNFRLAHDEYISTWAYRWIASMWEHDGYCLSPNKNLVTYGGYTDGTHTLRRARWEELPVESLSSPLSTSRPLFDRHADDYLHRVVFGATPIGIASTPAERVALRMRSRRTRQHVAR